MSRNQIELGDPDKVLSLTLGCSPDDIAESVVVTPFIPLKYFRRMMDPETVRELNPRFFFKGVTGVYGGEYGGKRITVVLTGVGPSRVGDLVSILSLTPARRVLFVGAVGALHPEWKIGEFFLARTAADGEGYARYCRMDMGELIESAHIVGCRGELHDELESFLVEKGENHRSGSVFTIGSIAHESHENLQALASAGFDVIEMELSAFFEACDHHGFDGAALAYVSDLPITSPVWQDKTPEEEKALKRAWRMTPRLCLEFLASLG